MTNHRASVDLNDEMIHCTFGEVVEVSQYGITIVDHFNHVKMFISHHDLDNEVAEARTRYECTPDHDLDPNLRLKLKR